MKNIKKIKCGSRVLAVNKTVSNNTRETGLNNNDLIIGPSGAGKTGGYVIPNMLEGNESLIVADTKCNLYRKLGPAMRAKGYKTYSVNFVNPENSYSYNPFDYIRRNKDGTPNEMDICSVSNVIIPITVSKNPFWEISAQNVLHCLIAFTIDMFSPEEQNLFTVNTLFHTMMSQCTNDGVQFLNEYTLTKPDSFAARRYKMFKNVVGVDKTWNCISQFLSNGISIFGIDGAKQLFSGSNKIRIPDISHEKSVIFLNVSDSDGAFDKLINLFYTQAFQSLMLEADRSPSSSLDIPVRIILDDFATNVNIPDFDKIISVIRSRNISASIVLQSLSQLNSGYSSGQAGTIINNYDHILYLGGMDLDTIRYISVRTNKAQENIMAMPVDKAYLLERGKAGELVDKIRPYSFEFPNGSKEFCGDDCSDTKNGNVGSIVRENAE